jgi:hypothetical protein
MNNILKAALMMSIVMTLLAVPALAIPATPMKHIGHVYIGGVIAPAGVTVNATSASGDKFGPKTTSSSGLYSLDITFDDSDTPGVDEGATNGETITWYVNGVSARTDTANTSVALVDPFDLNISASCSDGLQNGDETGVDCGGSCPMACYALTAALSAASVDVPANSSGTTILTITNTGKNNLAGLSVSAPAFSPTQGSITVTFVAPATTLRSGRNVNVTLNITVAPNTTENIYSGAINVTATNVSLTQVTLTINTVAAGEVVKRSKRIELTATGLEGAPICLGAPVVVKAIDERRNEPLDKADVDVYLGEKLAKNKVFYGDTDDNGEYQFTPKEAGDYIITVSKTGGYREAELKVTVKACVVEITTVPVTTTITVPVVTTTTPKYTTSSTVPVTTTAPKVTTTVYKPPVTTVAAVPPVAPPKGAPWGTIILVLVIVVILAAIYTQSKGKKAAPAAEEPKKEEKKK